MKGEVIVKDGSGVRIRWEDGQLGYYQFTDLLSQRFLVRFCHGLTGSPVQGISLKLAGIGIEYPYASLT